MPCRTKPETISTDKQRPYGCPRRCSLTPMTIPVMKQQSTHHNNYYRCTWHLVLNCTILYWSPLYTKENRVKSTNVCVYKHKPYVLGTTYVSVHKNNSNRGAADPYASRRQRKNSSVHDGECTYGLSDWFTIPQNQVKVESLTEPIVDKAKYAHPGLFEPRPSTASVWPTAGLLACDLCVFLNVTDFGPNVARYTWSWLAPPQASIIPGTWYLGWNKTLFLQALKDRTRPKSGTATILFLDKYHVLFFYPPLFFAAYTTHHKHRCMHRRAQHERQRWCDDIQDGPRSPIK